ncbi:hypothetical protein U9M48_039723 [Paspalum notatum var. saurae]|uniref:Uncharacterized protein n=1 Tax=Paspalum notatum var. saurae TaxID=547442 RepID=A0AAQ3UKL2_PASNO
MALMPCQILHRRPIKVVTASAAIPFGHPLPRSSPSAATASNFPPPELARSTPKLARRFLDARSRSPALPTRAHLRRPPVPIASLLRGSHATYEPSVRTSNVPPFSVA